jgi:DNA modification methylase
MTPRLVLPKIVKPPGGLFKIHQGDARNLDFLLGKYSSPAKPLLTTTITSPPYGDLKDYGHRDQIGFGQPYEEYLIEIKRIFRNVYAHTRDDGSLWLVVDTLRPGDEGLRRLEPLPFQITEELSEIGWILRDIIIWKKDKTLPWSGRGRLRNAFEYILYFVKGPDFKYHVDSIRDTEELEEWWVKWPERYNPRGKVPDNVWEFEIPVQGAWGTTAIQHACPLPPDLVERMILLSTDRGDVVLDPFAGSGVVIAEAERHKRKGIGIELVKKHINAFEKVVRPEIIERGGPSAELRRKRKAKDELRDTILNLRGLKYPRVLMKEMLKKHPDLPRPALAIALIDDLKPENGVDPNTVLAARYVFVYETLNGEVPAIRAALEAFGEKRPASKFGVAAKVDVATRSELPKLLRGQSQLFLYEGGRTYQTTGVVDVSAVRELQEIPNRANCPPIVGNVMVDETPRRLSAASS